MLSDILKAIIACKNGIRPNRYSSRVTMVIGLFLSSVVTIAIIAEWFMLLRTPRYSGDVPIDGVSQQDYLRTIQGFRSIYTFLYSYRLLITINVILFTTRLVTLLSYYEAFSLINSTLEVAIIPTITVLIYVIISLLAVAAITTVNFGPDTTAFSVFSTSLLTLVRFLSMGDYDFEEIEFTQNNKTLYIIFYVLFVIYGVCALLNLFLAVIYDAFDASQLKSLSIEYHGSQLHRTFYAIRYWLWPWSVLKMLGNPKKEAKFTKGDLETRSIDIRTIEKLLKVYGTLQTSGDPEDESFQENQTSIFFFKS